MTRLEATGTVIRRLEARDATLDELLTVHDPAYVAALYDATTIRAVVDPDTYVVPQSIDAARRAAGGALAVVDALLGPDAEATVGAALLRPPGHHATRSRGMGFCLLNNVALAARHAVTRGGLSRVAVIDWDVHHGNGTQDIFWSDPSVLYVSIHQQPLFPGTGADDELGAGEGYGHTVNVPLSAGATDATYAAAFDRVVLPVLEAYAPELVLVSAGFDAHERDPLGSMLVTDGGFGRMAAALASVADRHAGGRLALVLEGGYDLAALESSLTAALRGALEPTSPGDETMARNELPSAEHAAELARASRAASRVWAGL